MSENNTVGFNDKKEKNFDEKSFEDLYRRMYPTLKNMPFT